MRLDLTQLWFHGAEACNVKHVHLLQEDFEKMASRLSGNSIRCPGAGWTMLGPGSHD